MKKNSFKLILIALIVIFNITSCSKSAGVDYNIYNKYQRAFNNVKEQESYTLTEDIDATIIINEEETDLRFTNSLKYQNTKGEPVYNLSVKLDDSDMSIDSYFANNDVYIDSGDDEMMVDVTKVFIKYELINFATSSDKSNLKSASLEHDKTTKNDIVTLFFEGQSYVRYVEELSDLGLTDINVESFYPTEIKVVATIDSDGMLICEEIYFDTYSEVSFGDELKNVSLKYVANTNFIDVNSTIVELPNFDGTTQIDITETLNFIRDFKDKIVNEKPAD